MLFTTITDNPVLVVRLDYIVRAVMIQDIEVRDTFNFGLLSKIFTAELEEKLEKFMQFAEKQN